MAVTTQQIYPIIHPKQAQLMWLHGLYRGYAPPDGIPVNESVFGGAGGGGKSRTLRMMAATVAQLWPGSVTAIIRRAGPDLKKTQIDPFRSEMPKGIGEYNSRDSEWTWSNGSKTQFLSCFEDLDYLRFKSYEWAALFIDEATEFSEEALTFMRSRVRWSNQPAWYPIIVCATNPGGVGHVYLKGNFVDPGILNNNQPFWGPEIELPNGQKVRSRRAFLQAKLSDNPSLTYEQAMASMMAISDPELRRAIAEGEWELNMGQFFSSFRRNIHTVEPFAIPKEWPHWRSIDWGYSAPAACLWYARDIETMRTYVYREWVQAQVVTQKQALTIRNLSQGDPLIRLNLADPSMWRKTKGVGTSEAEEYAAAGVPLTRANNNRKQGWNRIHRALDVQHGFGPGLSSRNPELQIFNTCPVLINALGNVQRSTKDYEDIREPTNADDPVRDDVLDSLRYGLQGAAVASRTKSTTRHWGMRPPGQVIARTKSRRS